jgi:hypothetical protein
MGYGVASTTLAGGSNNILVGTSSSVDTPASSTNSWLNIGNVITGNMTELTSGALACGTSPAINAQASDLNGTITAGTTLSSCVLTFTTGKSAAPTCVVTARSGTPAAYTTSTTALTITTSTNGAIFDYMCSGK